MEIAERITQAAAEAMSKPAAHYPLVAPATRNDLTPVVGDLAKWVQELTNQLEKERALRVEAQMPHQILKTALDIYQAVCVCRVGVQGRASEHEFAKQRMSDIIDVGLRAWEEMLSKK